MAKIATYEEFWPYYLTQHAQPLTRRLHTLGAVLGIGLLVLGVIQQKWVDAALAPVAAYGLAWFSHFFVERNRPATWDDPLWSLRSEGRMAWGVLCGRL